MAGKLAASRLLMVVLLVSLLASLLTVTTATPAQAATWKAGTISCGSGYQVTLYSNAYGREIWHRWGRTSYTNKRVFRLRNPYQYQTDVTRTGYQAVYWRIDAVGNGPHGGPRLAGWDAICQR